VTPVEALQRIVHCLDRAHVTGFKTKAWVRALDVVMTTDPAELEERARAGTLTELPGIGDSTARVIREAIDGEVPVYVTKLEAEMRERVHAIEELHCIERGHLTEPRGLSEVHAKGTANTHIPSFMNVLSCDHFPCACSQPSSSTSRRSASALAPAGTRTT
jgi:hypothetical protein